MSSTSLRQVVVLVADLISESVRIPSDKIDIALAGHAALLQLVQEMHRDLANVSLRLDVPVTPHDIEQSPVLALGRLLHQHPRAHPPPVSEVMTRESPGRWRELLRQSTLATHEWPDHLAAITSAATAWGSMADVAALSHAITLLDADIARAFNTAGRLPEAAAFRTASTSGLRIAANETIRLAELGRLETVKPTYPQRRAVLTVPSAAAVPVALDRLAYLTMEANLTPAQADRIASTLTQAGATAASALKATGHDELAGQLISVTDELSAIAPMSRHIRQLDDGDTMAHVQAHRIDAALTQLEHSRTPMSEPIALATADAVRSGIPALSGAVQEQVRAGQWLVSSELDDAVSWRSIHSGGEIPDSVEHLAKAAEAAQALPITPGLDRVTALKPVQQVIREARQMRPRPDRPPWPGRGRPGLQRGR